MANEGINTGTVPETIPTEIISGFIIPAPNRLRVYEAITWQMPAPKGAKAVFPAWDAVAVTGVQTESTDFPLTDIATSKEEISPAMVGLSAKVSDQVALQGSVATPEAQVAKIADDVRNRIDKDVLALFVSATNVSDNSGSNLDLDLFDTALAALNGQKPNWLRIAFVGSTNQIRDLRKAIRQSGNGGLLMGAGLEVFNGLPNAAYVGTWQGVEIYQGNTTQADATNDAGGFVSCAPLGSSGPMGIMPGSGLGLAVWEGLKLERERRSMARSEFITVSSYYGCGVTADHNVRAFFSKKAA